VISGRTLSPTITPTRGPGAAIRSLSDRSGTRRAGAVEAAAKARRLRPSRKLARANRSAQRAQSAGFSCQSALTSATGVLRRPG
jgi:hypothetical protein